MGKKWERRCLFPIEATTTTCLWIMKEGFYQNGRGLRYTHIITTKCEGQMLEKSKGWTENAKNRWSKENSYHSGSEDSYTHIMRTKCEEEFHLLKINVDVTKVRLTMK